MKLYTFYGSPNSRKVLAVIHALKIDVEVIYLDLFEDEHCSSEYLALNPNGKVPTLVDGNFVLWESNAINMYLTEKYNSTDLYPKDLKIRSYVNQWLCWELTHFNKAFATLSYEAIVKPEMMKVNGNQVLIEQASKLLAQHARVLNNYIQDLKYLVGSNITIADYAMIHIEYFKEQLPFDWSPYPYVNRYYESISKNESWLSTVPQYPEYLGRIPPQ